MLHPGQVLDRHYRIEKALAVGGAGLTYLARELAPDGETAQGPDLAIKVLYAQRDAGNFLRRLNNEAQILQELAHDNIVECRGFVHRSGHAPYLVTLFEQGGSLGDHLDRHGPLPPRAAAGILRQVLLALDTAHQRAIVHRDLKPENVLLRAPAGKDEIPRVRVADFGIAKVAAIGDQLTRIGSFVGTPEYAAPEQFRGEEPGPATDVFAAGALFWALLTDTGPVAFTDRMDVARCHEELITQVPPALPWEVSEDAHVRELVQMALSGMMQVDPDRRWTIQQILVALNGLLDGEPRKALRTLEVTNTTQTPGPATRWVQQPRTKDEAVEEPRGGGAMGTLVGVGGPLLAGVLGVPLVAILLAVVALATGWFAAAPSPSDAVEVDGVTVRVPATRPPVRDLATSTDPEDVSERQRLTRALTRAGQGLQQTCRLDDALIVDLIIGDSGRVRDVDVRSTQDDADRRCVVRTLRRQRLARTTTGDVKMRVTLSFTR